MSETGRDSGADWPQERSETDVALVARGVVVTARVEAAPDGGLVLQPVEGGRAAARPGDEVQLYWVSGYEERTLPARIDSVAGETGGAPWRLAATGPAERSTRRGAVRGRVSLPASLPWDGGQLTGTTVDLSESGTRLLLGGHGMPPDPGTRVDVSIDLGGDVVELTAEVVWHNVRGAQWLVAVQFADVPAEATERIRRRVIQALDDERAFIGG